MFYCIYRKETDQYFNLAAEEYMLREFPYDAFMVWRNDKSVIIGKHQNASREINHAYCTEHSLPVIRRITGGGTVYHDQGNINFSFITTGEPGKLVDFNKFTAPVIDFLESLGLNAQFEGKNNIRVNGAKVSGNAAHVYKNRVIHHGTLLYNANLEALQNSIAGNEASYHDRSVRSIRTNVANLKHLLNYTMNTAEFSRKFFDHIVGLFSPSVMIYEWKDRETERIKELKKSRYLDPAWNMGYSPDYNFHNSFSFHEENIVIRLTVKKGRIEEAEISCTGNIFNELKQIEKSLKGVDHERYAIGGLLKDLYHPVDGTELGKVLLDNMF